MEDLYRVVSSSPDQIINMVHFDPIKAHIAHHPRYPFLLAAYIECCKVGAPPEMASLLEEISHQSRSITGDGSCCSSVGTDPELDEFMESYCKLLHKYKEELSKPFIEATSFLSSIQSQLSNLSTGVHHSDEAAGISDKEPGCGGEVEELDGQECCSPCPSDLVLKEALMQKYSGYLCNLRNDFLSKRKKGKLPENAKTTLLDWWSTHYRWPYPTEEEKMKLSEITGLDPRQINNWFINQRKRHWKPSESMRVALMEGVGGNIGGSHAP